MFKLHVKEWDTESSVSLKCQLSCFPSTQIPDLGQYRLALGVKLLLRMHRNQHFIGWSQNVERCCKMDVTLQYVQHFNIAALLQLLQKV